PCNNARAFVLVGKELRLALDLHAAALEMLDEKRFGPILSENEHVRKRRLALADGAQLDMRPPAPPRPEIDPGEFQAGREGLVGDAELAKELEGARMHDESARGRSGLGRLVDDAHRHA